MKLKQVFMLLTGLIPRHGAGKLTAPLVVISASLLALSTAPANATPLDGPIRNAAYNQCIDAPGGALNARLKLVACSGSSTQQWEFMPTGTTKTYVIRNKASGFCMEVNNGTSTPKEAVDQFTCNRQAPEQQWVVNGDRLMHALTNQCLDTVGGPGSELMQYTCGQADPANVQSWITPVIGINCGIAAEAPQHNEHDRILYGSGGRGPDCTSNAEVTVYLKQDRAIRGDKTLASNRGNGKNFGVNVRYNCRGTGHQTVYIEVRSEGKKVQSKRISVFYCG